MSFKVSHIKYYIITILVVLNLSQYFYLKGVYIKHTKDLLEIREAQKEKYSTAIDSSLIEIERIKNKSTIRIDSILKTKIKYVKFEVPTYIDRTFDDAIRVHTEYKESERSY